MQTLQKSLSKQIPLVARFAVDRFDHEDPVEGIDSAKVVFSPFGEHTVTYDWTTKRGDDKDKTDQYRD